MAKSPTWVLGIEGDAILMNKKLQNHEPLGLASPVSISLPIERMIKLRTEGILLNRMS